MLANKSQHCSMLHVASVCTSCCMLLGVVALSLMLRLNGRNNSQQCWELLANNVASVFTGINKRSCVSQVLLLPLVQSPSSYPAFTKAWYLISSYEFLSGLWSHVQPRLIERLSIAFIRQTANMRFKFSK